MKSDRGLTHEAPRYTRVTTPDGRTWVALGSYTEKEMLDAIGKIEARREGRDVLA